MKFRYKDKIIETPNLEKKLKRMKISIQDIEILDEEEVLIQQGDDTPQWKLDGYIKHCWINNDESSEEYKWSIIGFHKKDTKPVFSNSRNWDLTKVIYKDNIN